MIDLELTLALFPVFMAGRCLCEWMIIIILTQTKKRPVLQGSQVGTQALHK